jgi:adenylosuccinate lyase
MCAREAVRFGKMSGVVGAYGNIDPRVERITLKKLGLSPEPVSTQVVPRDRHAEYFSTLAIVAAGVERMAVELRHLQRTEVREVEESFGTGQKGSSAMPHKKNPVSAENLSGLARLIRSNAMAALENVALWHQRDISHSSVERIIAPDSTIALDYMLARAKNLIANLAVYPDAMAHNLVMTRGLIFSETVMLALIEKGLSRDEAYRLVQRNAMKVWEKHGTTFRSELMSDREIVKTLGKKALDECFNLDHHLRHVDEIFNRVLGKSERARQSAHLRKKSRVKRRNGR